MREKSNKGKVTFKTFDDDGLSRRLQLVDHDTGQTTEIDILLETPPDGWMALGARIIGSKDDPFWPELDGIFNNCCRILKEFEHKKTLEGLDGLPGDNVTEI